MALPGITNSNEFYSAHYLETVLMDDIKQVSKRWTDDAKAQKENNPLTNVYTPEQRFRALRKSWQNLREKERGIKNDPAERLRLQRDLFYKPLCDALGYTYSVRSEPALVRGESYQIPLLGEVKNGKGEPFLWLVECFNPSDESIDPLELTIANKWACQIKDPTLGYVFEEENWEVLISERIFGQDFPPRWIVVVSRDQLLLIDRQKWASSRLIRFDLHTILGDNNPDALLATVTMLHREHTCPADGSTPFLDEFDDNSHKHAYEVSDDLKYALRTSIELLGNEAIHWRKSRNEAVFKGKTDAENLTLECLRYMYRLLFLFYIESRPDLGYAPMGSDIYRLGYSLESLREMDTAELGSEEDKQSFYISDSLDRLFQMIWNGYPRRENPTDQVLLNEIDNNFYDSFRLTPLRAHLFDPDRLPTLTRVRFRNVVMREIIELMSLTKLGKRKRRGRVSYSQLGINQLGAVYEALLSFKGFFAETDLFEVKPSSKSSELSKGLDEHLDFDNEVTNNIKASGSAHDELEVGHFVSADELKSYKSEEIVPDLLTGNPKCYPKGSFIYRLAGRDRENSASYYTHESLTKCLVKYALKEILPGKTSEEILNLRICEPAMGSAAFLNEVVNQLALAYIEIRQNETGKSIHHDQFATEIQKVKMRLADQNVFGVDLNPVAVELAEVSLWLNSIFAPEKGRAFVPWFSQQLLCGNSLIGARRQFYRVNQLPSRSEKSFNRSTPWYDLEPEELAWDSELPEDAIFHFLLPHPGMAAYPDKIIKQLEAENVEYCKKWNKGFVGDPFTDDQIAHLLRLSRLVDALWKEWIIQQKNLRNRTTDPLPVWNDPTGMEEGDWTPLKMKDRIQELEVQGRYVSNSNARLRLKWTMDYWIALWFWPINQAKELPSRELWLMELSMILGDLEHGTTPQLGQQNLFAETQPKKLAIDFSDRHGYVNIESLRSEFERLNIVANSIKIIKPFHWHLEFADILADRGFDLIIGNPPWIRISWKPTQVLEDYNPLLSGKFANKLSSNSILEICLSNNSARKSLLAEAELLLPSQQFLSKNMPHFLEGNFNLYKCFFGIAEMICEGSSTIAFLHDSGTYESKKERALRQYLYPRMERLFRFENQLQLFKELGHARSFEGTIYNHIPKKNIQFDAIFYLYHPSTIDLCYEDVSESIVSTQNTHSIKTKWDKNGSLNRIIKVSDELLFSFSNLLSHSSEGRSSSQLISLKLSSEASVIQKLSEFFSSNQNPPQFFSTPPLPEKVEEKAGTIVQLPGFNKNDEIKILSGPNAIIGNCFGQSCHTTYKSHQSFSNICLDSAETPINYLPRQRYKISNLKNFNSRYNPIPPWSKERLTKEYRMGLRKMLDNNEARTLKPFIIPPGFAHVESITSFAFERSLDLLKWTGLFSSICLDFIFRRLGKSSFYPSDFEGLRPSSEIMNSSCLEKIAIRALILNSVSTAYSELWESISSELSPSNQEFSSAFSHWLKPILINNKFREDIIVRNSFQRRLLLIEIDVLAAIALGLELKELESIFTNCFSVYSSYEKTTSYDQNGRHFSSTNKQIGNVCLKDSELKKEYGTNWKDVLCGEDNVEKKYTDNSLSDSYSTSKISFKPPIFFPDRILEYRIAWDFFQNEGIN